MLSRFTSGYETRTVIVLLNALRFLTRGCAVQQALIVFATAYLYAIMRREEYFNMQKRAWQGVKARIKLLCTIFVQQLRTCTVLNLP